LPKELVERLAAFEVVEQRLHRHPCVDKHGRSAEDLRIAANDISQRFHLGCSQGSLRLYMWPGGAPNARNTSAVSVALARQLLWRMLGAEHPMEAHRLDSRCMDWTGRSADAYEGVTAFLEKRPARFTLRPSADMPPFYPWWPQRPF